MTSDGFTRMIDDANAFFAELKENNSKEWFDPRKAHYNEAIRKPAEFFAELMAEDLSRLAGRAMQPKVFRIYRDVRFSKDKTPLNAHLHMMWAAASETPFSPFYFFGTEPGDMTVGFGISGLQKEGLAQFRAFVDREGDRLEEAIAQTGMRLSSWGEPPLKKVPKPYDADHPQAELLKRKNLILQDKMDDGWRRAEGGLVSAVRAAFERTEPVRLLVAEALPGRA